MWPGVWTRAELDIAHHEGVAVFEQPVVVAVLRDPLVLPIGVTLVRDVDPCPVTFGELARAREEIGVDVGLGNRRDAKSLRLCERDVAIDVPLRVDHDGVVRFLTADEVGVLREPFVEHLTEEHDVNPSGLDGSLGPRPARGRYQCGKPGPRCA